MLHKRTMFLMVALVAVGLAGLTAPAVFSQAKQPKETVILKGAPIGGVKFEHKLHEGYAEKKCETCHHASKPEKANTAPQQACFDCHATPAKAPMKTNRQAAFHNPLGKAGTCIDCHLAQNAKGKKAPVGPKCMDCHKKENI
jgi:hypothetical protein